MTGAAAFTSGMAASWVSTPVVSNGGASCRERTISAWAYAPMNFSIRLVVKPSITASTTMSANTPTATPPTEMKVIAETSALCWPENR